MFLIISQLGITTLPTSSFNFVTRFHYWAADTVTYGSNSKWGEHEIVYILFAKGNPEMKLNEEEVSEVMWVGMEELKEVRMGRRANESRVRTNEERSDELV